MLKYILIVLMLCVPTISHALVFWDDEMESTVAGQFYYSDWFSNGSYTIDNTVKFSGTGSKRVTLPANCDITLAEFRSGLQCGNEIGRSFPASADVYGRVHFMMSGSSTPITDPTSNCFPAVGNHPAASRDAQNKCLFRTSQVSSTKLSKRQSAVNSAFTEQNIRAWWQIGRYGGTNLILSAEHVPTYGGTTETPFSSINFQSNRWYCIETHEKVNTGGLANGIGQAWVDGVQVLNRTDIIWQRAANGTVSPGNYLWNQFAIMRQNGAGWLWWDRYAAGDARIPCVGSPAPGDTTPPTPPTGLTAQ